MIRLPISAAVRRISKEYEDFILTIAKSDGSFRAVLSVSGLTGPTVEAASPISFSDAIFQARVKLEGVLPKAKEEQDIFESTRTEADFDEAVADLESSSRPGNVTLPLITFTFY